MIQVPDGWEMKPLKDILSIQYGKDQKEVELVNGKYPILGSGGVIGYTNHFLYDKPSVLIGRKGTINNPQYMETPFWTVDTLFYSHIKNKNIPKWVYYVFQSINWNSYNEASGVPSLSTTNINRIEILKPTIKEQEKIAKILSTLDNAIESTNRIIEKEKNIKTALMQELLTNGIDKNGQIRTPQTHTYKQSELGLIPDEWEVKALKSVGSCKNGLTYSPDDIVESDGVLVLRSSNIKNNKLTFSDNVFVREDMKINYKVQENDILICVRNGSKNLIGKNALITRESINMAHGAFMTVFHSNINEYVFQLFQSDLFFKQVEKNLGATINSINNSDLLLFDFSFPKDEIEQKQITKILTTQDKKIETEEKNLAKLKELKKGLMNDLLSGVVRVNV